MTRIIVTGIALIGFALLSPAALAQDAECSHCGPGPNWVDGCPAGYDNIGDHALLIGIQVVGNPPTNLIMYPCPTAPVMEIHRSAGAGGEIDTEILALCFIDFASGIKIRAGAGTGVGPYGATLQASTGVIVQRDDDNTKADSFFDIYFEVEFPGTPSTFGYNQVGMRIENVIECVPPGGHYIKPSGNIALFTDPNPAVPNVHVGNLVEANHSLYPKMHWPQWPDPDGWDVKVTKPKILADDWQCKKTEPVTEICFWGSWKDDMIGKITNIHMSIHSDIPSNGFPFSRPGNLLWQRDFPTGTFTVEEEDPGDQGWYDPNLPPEDANTNDHTRYFRYCVDIPLQEAHEQFAGTIYWLDIQVTLATTNGIYDFGWKTSSYNWNDDAVWGDWDGVSDPNLIVWNELRDPINSNSLDLAFVINGQLPPICWNKRIPTVTEWGLIVMTLLLLTAGTVIIAKRRKVVATT